MKIHENKYTTFEFKEFLKYCTLILVKKNPLNETNATLNFSKELIFSGFILVKIINVLMVIKVDKYQNI